MNRSPVKPRQSIPPKKHLPSDISGNVIGKIDRNAMGNTMGNTMGNAKKIPPPRISLLNLQKNSKPLSQKSIRLNREQSAVDLLASQLKNSVKSSSIIAPSIDLKTIQRRVSKPSIAKPKPNPSRK